MVNYFKQKLKTILYKITYSLKNKNVYIPISCTIGIGSVFEGYNRLGARTNFKGQLGLCSYVGEDCCIYGKVGRFCSISNNVKVLTGSHPAGTFVSSSPVFYAPSKQCGISFVNHFIYEQQLFADKKYNVIIGNDVWVGYGATIMGGIRIGDGAIIASNATVIKDVPPYCIVGGVPAKVLRRRFSDQQIDTLLQYKWWDKPLEWIQNNANLFSDINTFIEKIQD